MNRARPATDRIDRLGALLVVIGALAVALLPPLVFKTNRIMPGEPRQLFELLPAWGSATLAIALLCAALAALLVRDARVRLVAAVAAIAVLALSLGCAADMLTPPGNRVLRVAPGSGFWILVVALGLLATDALTRLRPGPLWRVLILAAFLAVVIFALGSGRFDDLSIMREYAVNADRFAQEARRHLLLALGTLLAAVIIALPLGVVCHRVPRLRAGVLGVLNLVQTVPSIALFGILMAPLAALALAFPALAALGVSGIGAAPAAIALFLYSLLPIVANTVVGLGRVSPAAVDAARGMGLTAAQVLREVELPLAMPAILTGIRIVLVQNIGMVTIAALIGGGGFGAFVFQGIGQTAIDLVLLGAIPTIVLAFSAAVVLDALTDLTRRVPQ
jgi:osmoprotectant transport system permease protein